MARHSKAAVQSAQGRLDAARLELARLYVEEQGLLELITRGLITGQDTATLTTRRERVSRCLHDLALMIHGSKEYPELGLENAARAEKRVNNE